MPRKYVAVCGASEATASQLASAREVGRLLAEAGVVVINGGLGGVSGGGGGGGRRAGGAGGGGRGRGHQRRSWRCVGRGERRRLASRRDGGRDSSRYGPPRSQPAP